MSKQYYIVSVKHTSKGDTALTFWGPNKSGYSWHRPRVGVYEEHQLAGIVTEDNPAVEKDIADKFWMNALDFRDEYISIPNTQTVLFHLGISNRLMKPKKFAGCRMTFINTSVTAALNTTKQQDNG